MSSIKADLGLGDLWIPDEETPCFSEPDIWSDNTRPVVDRAYAKRACLTVCNVRAECLEAGLKDDNGKHWQNRNGIWGGLSVKERYLLDKAKHNLNTQGA